MTTENMYRRLFESASEAIILLEDGRCIDANASALKLFRCERNDLVGQNLSSFAPTLQPDGENSAQVFAEKVQAASSEPVQNVNWMLQQVTGAVVQTRLDMHPLDVDGKRILQVVLHPINQQQPHGSAPQAESSMLERRSRQVQLATQVNQAIAVATNLEDLYRRVVTQIKEQFHYYHTQLLRYDPHLKAAVLVAGYGKTGTEMLAHGHQLKLGEGLVGLAVASGKSALRSTVADDPDWKPNPFLPDTAGELAVPIKLGVEILGVLDVQSDVPGLLDADDQLMLEGLCGQIAIAIESTRLRQEMEDRLRELSALQQLTTVEGWQAYQQERSRSITGYQFNQGALEVIVPDDPDSDADATTNPLLSTETNTITQPMDVHGHLIGELGVYDDPENPLTDEERSLLEDVSTQIAEALERARLFEETRKQATELKASLSETESLYRASRAIGAASTVEATTQGAAEIAVTLGMAFCTLTLFTDFDTTGIPTKSTLYSVKILSGKLAPLPPVSDVDIWDHSAAAQILTNPQLIVIYTDIMNPAESVPPDLRSYLRGLNLRGTVLLGIQARGKPVGFLNYHSPQPLHNLTEHHLQQMRTVADQVAISIENQRLLVQARARARRERLSREISTKLTGSIDVETIMKTAARELAQTLGVSHAIIRLGVPPTDEHAGRLA